MGYRKTGSTVIMVENTELTEKVNNIEGELDKSNKQSVTLTHGLQVVNAEQNSPLDVSIEGRTLVNLLGKDGNFESLSGLVYSFSPTAELDSTKKIYGNNAIKLTLSQSSATVNFTLSKYKVDKNKYYIAVLEGDSGTLSTGIRLRFLGDSSGSDTAIFSTYMANKGVTYIKLKPSDFGDIENYLNIYMDGASGEYGFADGLRLYEITQDEYNNIGTTWDDAEVARRYPYVDSVQHVQNPYVIAEGENLLPPFTDSKWYIPPSGAEILSPYEIKHTYGGGSVVSYIEIPCKPNTTYTLSGSVDAVNSLAYIDALTYDSGATMIQDNPNIAGTGSVTFTTPANASYMRIRANLSTSGTFKFKNLMLTVGNQSKPFVPRNPSALYAELKLGALSDKKDILYKSDGDWYVRKHVEKDVVLDGSLGWVFKQDYSGFKRVQGQNIGTSVLNDSEKVVKYDGKILKHVEVSSNDWSSSDNSRYYTIGVNELNITISDTDSGWGETYTPTSNEVKAYFWGWRMCDGTYGNKWTGTGTKTWHPIADTDLNRAVTSVPTSEAPTITEGKINYYRLSYVLATPQTINVTDKVEGELVVNGATQVKAGSGFTYTDTDGQRDYTLLGDNDRYDVTTNLLSAPSTYNSSLKSVVDDVVAKQADISSTVSVHVRAIAELYKRVKALGG